MPEIEYLLYFFKTWGVVVGLGFDILGAILVWFGVRISIEKANALEQVSMPELFDDIGSVENIAENRVLSAQRAKERVVASRWAAWGLISFVVGFSLQIFASWPDQ